MTEMTDKTQYTEEERLQAAKDAVQRAWTSAPADMVEKHALLLLEPDNKDTFTSRDMLTAQLELNRLRSQPAQTEAQSELPELEVNNEDSEKAHWCGMAPYGAFPVVAKQVIFCRERQLRNALSEHNQLQAENATLRAQLERLRSAAEDLIRAGEKSERPTHYPQLRSALTPDATEKGKQ